MDSHSDRSLMVRRVFDARAINVLMNDESIFPHIGPWGTEKPIDFSQFIRNVANVALLTASETGGFIYHCHEPGVYEVHSFFLPKARGALAFEAARDGLFYMFTQTDCIEVHTKVPSYNLPAMTLAKAVGFARDYVVEGAWRRSEHTTCDLHYLAYTYRDFVRTSPHLAERGEWFHKWIEERGSAPNHGDDVGHDRVVGATLAMIRAGQLDKAIALYNRWARVANYGTLTLLSRSPVLLGMSDGKAILVECGEPTQLLRGV